MSLTVLLIGGVTCTYSRGGVPVSMPVLADYLRCPICGGVYHLDRTLGLQHPEEVFVDTPTAVALSLAGMLKAGLCDRCVLLRPGLDGGGAVKVCHRGRLYADTPCLRRC